MASICAPAVEVGNVDCTKPLTDRKLYRLLRLMNGMRVLLVSDVRFGSAQPASFEKEAGKQMHPPAMGVSSENKADASIPIAAAALCVGVGSFSDPLDLPGCAHFTEHMVFMGSEAYPDENSYDAYLSERGGYANAYTDGEETCFELEVNASYLEGALDRMCAFFTAPLLKEDAMDRELQAVESEFQQARLSDNARLSSLMSDLIAHSAGPGHPLGKFSWGNKQSLKDTPAAQGVPVLDKLKAFHAQHYVANKMHLVVQAPFDLNALQSMVVGRFGAIRCAQGTPKYGLKQLKEIPGATSTSTLSVVLGDAAPVTSVTHEGAGHPLPGRLPLLVRVRPQKPKLKILLAWPIPASVLPLNRGLQCLQSHPDELVAHLLGHESKGSIADELKQRAWVVDLSAGISAGGDTANSCCCWMEISMLATAEGMRHWGDVVRCVFEYLGMVRQHGASHLEWAHHEVQALSDMGYKYREDDTASEFASGVAGSMAQSVGDDEVVHMYSVAQHWSPHLVEQVLDCLKPDNMLVTLVSRGFSIQEASDLVPDGSSEDGSDGSDDDGSDDGGSDGESGDEGGDTSTPAKCSGPRHRADSDSDEEGAATSGGVAAPASLPYVSSAPLDGKETWFGTPFSTSPAPTELLQSWAAAYQGAGASALFPKLALPCPNPYIPRSFELVGGADMAHAAAEAPAISHLDSMPNLGFCTELGQCELLAPSAGVPQAVTTFVDFTAKACGIFQVTHDSKQESPVQLPSTCWPQPSTPQLQPPAATATVISDKCYWLHTPRFQLPKSAAEFVFRVPSLVENSRDIILAELWCRYVNTMLTDSSYHASLAGLSMKVSAFYGGFTFSVEGYHDRLPQLLECLLQAFLHTPVQENVLLAVIEAYLRSARSALLRPTDAAAHYRLRALLAPVEALESQLSILGTVTAAEVAVFMRQSLGGAVPVSEGTTPLNFNGSWLEGLIVGNESKDSALCMYTLARETLLGLASGGGAAAAGGWQEKTADFESATTAQHSTVVYARLPAPLEDVPGPAMCLPPCLPNPRVALLAPASCTVQHVPAFRAGARNCCVHKYFQLGLDHTSIAAAASLLQTLLQEPLFDELRTKQQLGYTVSCSPHSTDGVVGFSFTVQSATASPAAVDAALEAFLLQQRSRITDTSDEAWQRMVQASITNLTQLESHAHELCHNLLHAIKRHKYFWCSPNAEALAYVGLTRVGLGELYDQLFSPSTRREYTVYVHAADGTAAASSASELDSVVRTAWPGSPSVPVQQTLGVKDDFEAWRQQVPRVELQYLPSKQ